MPTFMEAKNKLRALGPKEGALIQDAIDAILEGASVISEIARSGHFPDEHPDMRSMPIEEDSEECVRSIESSVDFSGYNMEILWAYETGKVQLLDIELSGPREIAARDLHAKFDNELSSLLSLASAIYRIIEILEGPNVKEINT